jgi:phenol 2-monooxygenase
LLCRSLEIFDSFDFADRVLRESCYMLELNLWNPDANGQIQRSDRLPDTTPGISRFQRVVLHQGRIERFFLDSIAEHSDIHVERGVLPESMKFDAANADDDDAYPIEVTVRHLTEEEATPRPTANGVGVHDGLFHSNLTPDDTADLLASSKLQDKAGSVESIRAKYVVGCDGAHSWVRNWLGYELRGVRNWRA